MSLSEQVRKLEEEVENLKKDRDGWKALVEDRAKTVRALEGRIESINRFPPPDPMKFKLNGKTIGEWMERAEELLEQLRRSESHPNLLHGQTIEQWYESAQHRSKCCADLQCTVSLLIKEKDELRQKLDETTKVRNEFKERADELMVRVNSLECANSTLGSRLEMLNNRNDSLADRLDKIRIITG